MDPRGKTSADYGIDLNTVDFEWVKNTDKPKLLKKALNALRTEG
jgi:hypothetical protein